MDKSRPRPTPTTSSSPIATGATAETSASGGSTRSSEASSPTPIYSEPYFAAVELADKDWVRAAATAHAAAVRAADAAAKARRLAAHAAHTHDGGRANAGAHPEQSVHPAEWASVVHAHAAYASASRAVEDTAAAHVAAVRAAARHEHAYELFVWDNDGDAAP